MDPFPGVSVRRRDQQRDDTRRDLALAAFDLATRHGLSGVRVPDIAAAAGVATRTFNNYFANKEEAIVWPAARHAIGVADQFRARPTAEPLGESLITAVANPYGPAAGQELPPNWLGQFRALVAAEPSLHGEYLKAAAAAQAALGDALAERIGGGASGALKAHVLAGMVTGAERAGVMHWMRHRDGTLLVTVRAAVRQAVAGLEGEAR
jgi:AcrR family transcriptional regulator